ncbi:hypothetical protein [Bifidobacterium mongoliense]|uniref:hypothetical protein n=1 Tax=Bifidobacterium mongoliense TaxID=518643 RepID=UPI002649B67E|nr:hypothetical protein [Bifidobacterium mongoliense]MDN5980266.1 hypothetical protein [Bifidobacterium mongoliense]
MPKPTARLTERFIERADATGMTDTALAAAIGVTKQFYSDVKLGKEQPTMRFMVGAVRAGLADNFADVAEPVEKAAA